MADLGTLWFGADIDISRLKQTIQQQNQSILDALKMNYDPASYRDMVNNLRTALSNETFQIKISTDAQNAAQNLRQQLNSVTGGVSGGNLAGLTGINGMTRDILNQREAVRDTRAEVDALREAWQRASAQYGRTSMQARAAQSAYDTARRDLRESKYELSGLNIERGRAQLAQKALNEHMRQASAISKQLSNDGIRLNTTLAGGLHISTQLGSALSNVFALYAARQFLSTVIEIGGQLEKQRISMGAIIGDTARANELFEQIKDLAIKSPFGVVELDQYSKQLAAYGIEQSKLFDMTKRLADISAGAGQDIGRLALALGHVKSATYLTGITLRQFSMNNIPMLKMLADYYTEVEKRAVSTAEVQKRISNRQVSYEDVEEQIRRMTDEGGQFFNMQEKISESLSAKFKNLKDSFDIMYGEIAESSVGDFLKGIASILTSMSRNWSEFAAILGAAAGALGVYKIALLPVNRAMMQFGQETVLTSTRLNAQRIALGLNKSATLALSAATVDTMVKQGLLSKQQLLTAVATKRLTVAQAELAATNFNVAKGELLQIASMGRWGLAMRTLTTGVRSLGVALKGLMFNPVTIALTTITAIAEVIMHFKNKADETKQSVKDLVNTANEGFENIQDVLKKFPEKALDSATMSGGIKEITEALKNYAPNDNAILEEANAITDLADRYAFLRGELESTKNAYADLEKTADYVVNANDATGNIINDTFTEQVDDYLGDLQKVRKAEQDFFYHRIAINDALEKIAKGVPEFAKNRYDEEGNLKSLKEQIELLKNIQIPNVGSAFSSFTQVLAASNNSASKALGEWSVALSNADKRMRDEVMPDLVKFAQKLDDAYKETTGWGENWKQNGDHVKAAILAVTKELEKIPDMTDAVKNDLLDKIFNEQWHLNIKFTTDEAEEELTGWQKEMQDYFDANHIYIRLTMSSTRESVISQIEEAKKNAQTIADNAGQVLIGIGFKLNNLPASLPSPLATPWNQDAFDTYPEQITYVNKLNDAIKKFNLNVKESNKNKPKGGTKKDTILEGWKEELKELENFYKVYKRNVEYMSKDDAIQKALDSGVFSLPKKAVENIDDYLNILNDFRKKVEAKMGKNPSTQRKSFLTDLLTKIDEKEFEVNIKKATDKALRELNEYISRNSEKYNLYESLLEKTGNKDYAKMAFDDGKIWDKVSEDFADKLKKAIESAGKEIDFSKLWDMSDAEAEEMLKGINGAYDLWKKIVEIVRGNYVKTLNKGADAISGTMKVEEKLVKLQEELLYLTEKYNKAQTEAEKVSLAAQIKAKKKEVDAAQIEKDNQDIETLQFYNAILSMTVDKAEEVGQKLRENLVRQLEDGKISAEGYVKGIKKIDQQIDTIREKKGFLSFAASGDFLAKRKLELETADDEWIHASDKLEKAVERLRKATEKKKAAKTDEEKKESDSEVESAEKEVAVAEANHEAANKNRDAAQKNYESALKFKASIAAIAMAVQAMVQAFNDAKQAAAAFGEDLDADMDSFGQHYMGILEGLNTGLSRAQQGDFAGAISGAVFGSIASIAQKHDATLQQDIKNSQLIVQRYDNMISILEKRLDNTLGGIYSLTISKEDVDKLYKYLGMQNPETASRIANGQASEAEMEDYIWEMTWARLGGIDTSVGRDLPEDTRNAVLKAIESQSYYDAKLAELYIQRDELQRQLADAEDMKDRDEAQIEDYKQQMAELEEDIKTFALDMANALYDIDIQGWASDLTDAIVEAWENGEDAVEAYNKKVKEMMKDLAKNIIAKKILEKALADAHIDDLISNLMTSSNGVLDESAVVALGDALMGAGQSAATATTALLDYLEAAGYIEKSAEVTETAFSDLRSTFLETLTDIESNAEDFKKSLEQIMVKDVIEKQILDVPFTINGMTFENFDAYLKNWNERYASAIKAGNQVLIDALIDELVQAREITIEAAEELRERLKSVEEDTTFSDMSDSWVSNLMDMSKTAEDWAEEVGKTMAEKIIKEMIVPTMIQPYLQALQNAWNAALPKYTTTDANGNTTYDWEGLLGDESILKALDSISSAYPAAREAVMTILEKLGIDISNYKYSGFDNLADSILESLKKSGNNFGDWAKEQGQKMAEQMAKAYIDQTYKNDIDALNKEWQEALEKGDAAAIDTVRKKLEALYARMGNDPELMKLIEDFKELDTTVTDLADSFVSSLMDMSQSARDWGQDLAKTIAEAVIKMTVVPTLIQPLLQSVQDVFNSAVEAASSIDANGKKTVDWQAIINNTDLMAAINGIVEQYPEIKGIVETILGAFGVNGENPFSGMASDFASSLMDMEQSAEDFANNIARNMAQSMIENMIKDRFQSEIDALGDLYKDALERGDTAAIERIRQALVELYEKIGEAVKPVLDSLDDLSKDTTFTDMKDAWVSALMDMEATAEQFGENVGKTIAQKVIAGIIAPKYIEPILKAMQAAADAAFAAPGATVQSVLAALVPYIGEIEDIYRQLQPVIQDIFGTIGITVAESVEEAAEEVQYALQDLKSNFVSALMDMTNSAEDFSKDISKIIAQTFIENFIMGDKFKAQMELWQQEMERIMSSPMSDEERKRSLNNLRDAMTEYKEGLTSQAMTLLDWLGLTTEDSQEATMNMADKITYDQADQLLGTSLAQLLVQEQILATLHGGSVSYTPSGTLTGGSVANNEQSQLMLATMQSMSQMMQDRQDGILTQVAMATSHLQLIRDYSKQIRDEVVMHMASVDNKLTYLRNL